MSISSGYGTKIHVSAVNVLHDVVCQIAKVNPIEESAA